MQTDTNGPAPATELAPHGTPRVDRKIIGGITLYPTQLAKLDGHAKANGLSRSAVLRQLIDQHL